MGLTEEKPYFIILAKPIDVSNNVVIKIFFYNKSCFLSPWPPNTGDLRNCDKTWDSPGQSNTYVNPILG